MPKLLVYEALSYSGQRALATGLSLCMCVVYCCRSSFFLKKKIIYLCALLLRCMCVSSCSYVLRAVVSGDVLGSRLLLKAWLRLLRLS